MTADPQAIAAAAASIVAQSISAGLDWSKVLGWLITVGVGVIAYLGATYKARHDAKSLQGSELSKATEVLIGGWESMTEQQQKILTQMQAEAMASMVRASSLQRELDEMRQRYEEARRELEELRGAARKKRASSANER